VPRLVFRPAAQQDFLDLVTHLARESHNLSLARKFVAGLRAKCSKLAALPGTLGHARPELHPEIRSFAFRSYTIFVRYHQSTFEVIRILEGHRDIPAIFRNTPGGTPQS
jgi:toxin ParE1/3/4